MYVISDSYTCKKYVYFSLANPNNFQTSNIMLEETGGRWLVITNDFGIGNTVAMPEDLQLVFTESGNPNAVAQSIESFYNTIGADETKFATIQKDIDGLTTTVGEIQTKNDEMNTKVTQIEQTAIDINLKVEDITQQYNSSEESKAFRETITQTLISYNTVLGAFSNDMSTYMKDGIIGDDELANIESYKTNLEAERDSLNAMLDEVLDKLKEEGKTDEYNLLLEEKTKFNASADALITVVDNATLDGVIVPSEMTGVVNAIGNVNSRIIILKNTIDDTYFLGVDGEIIENLASINITSNNITLSVGEIDQKVDSNDEKWSTIILDPDTGIQQKVEHLTTSIDGDGGLVERMTSAEEKITDEAIINTVKGSFYTKQEIDDMDLDVDLLELSTDRQAIAFDSDNNPKDTTDITLTVRQEGFDDEVVWTTSPVVTLTGTGLTRTLSISDFDSNDKIVVTVTAGSLSDTITLVKVSDGISGDAYTIILSNESHTFAGNTVAALPNSALCNVIAYKGATQIEATIGTITGMPNGMTVTIADNGTTNASFTVDVTNLMTTQNGTLTIPITVDGNNFTKIFTYALALEGQQGEAGEDAVSFYTWIRYADDENGTGISNDPTGKDYIGFAYNKTESTESEDPTDYIWSKIKGEDGVDGKDGTSISILGSYNTLDELNAAHPSGNNNGDGYIVDGNLYVWQGTSFINVGQIKGEDGKTPYLHIKYSNDGGTTFTPNSGEDAGDYMGQYVDFTETDSTNVADYTWCKIKGDQGIPGEVGADGKTYYTWIKYSDNEDGSGMYDTPNSETVYIGIATNKDTDVESNVASDYTWSKFKGDDGVSGEDGYTVILTNETHIVKCDQDGNPQ